MRKFVLLTRADDGRAICYRGEGTPSQIQKDIEKFKDPSELEILPVIGGRFQRESLFLGSLLGIGLGIIGYKVYAYIHKKCRKGRRVHTSN